MRFTVCIIIIVVVVHVAVLSCCCCGRRRGHCCCCWRCCHCRNFAKTAVFNVVVVSDVLLGDRSLSGNRRRPEGDSGGWRTMAVGTMGPSSGRSGICRTSGAASVEAPLSLFCRRRSMRRWLPWWLVWGLTSAPLVGAQGLSSHRCFVDADSGCAQEHGVACCLLANVTMLASPRVVCARRRTKRVRTIKHCISPKTIVYVSRGGAGGFPANGTQLNTCQPNEDHHIAQIWCSISLVHTDPRGARHLAAQHEPIDVAEPAYIYGRCRARYPTPLLPCTPFLCPLCLSHTYRRRLHMLLHARIPRAPHTSGPPSRMRMPLRMRLRGQGAKAVAEVVTNGWESGSVATSAVTKHLCSHRSR